MVRDISLDEPLTSWTNNIKCNCNQPFAASVDKLCTKFTYYNIPGFFYWISVYYKCFLNERSSIGYDMCFVGEMLHSKVNWLFFWLSFCNRLMFTWGQTIVNLGMWIFSIIVLCPFENSSTLPLILNE